MTDFWENFEDIKQDFLTKRISIKLPGFYDEPEFIAVEQNNPTYLTNYASYVQKRTYDPNYLDRARVEIPIIAKLVYEELKKDGRKGACVDASGVLSRILEKEGYWNFNILGSLTTEYPAESGIRRRYFWSVDWGKFTAGHAWVFAPPFCVIDITLMHQPYSDGEEAYLPEFVVDDEFKKDAPKIEDLVSPEYCNFYRSRGIPDNRLLSAINPMLPNMLSTFDTYIVETPTVSLKYVPFRIGAPDGPFADMTSILFSGKKGIEVYNDVIVPELQKIRN